jgi:hypothetical protein
MQDISVQINNKSLLMNTFQAFIKNKNRERIFLLHLIMIFTFTERNEKDN